MKQQQLEALLQEVLSQCRNLKIPVSDRIIPEVIINRRAKSRFASCRKVWINNMVDDSFNGINKQHKNVVYSNKPAYSMQRNYFLIEICEAMLDASEQEIKNVIAHEVLHTCYGCYNHGKRWKSYAVKMNKIYGYNITSTTTYEKLGLKKPEKKIIYRYKIQCQKCGKTLYRQKKSRLITNTGQYRCKCGGKLIMIPLTLPADDDC